MSIITRGQLEDRATHASASVSRSSVAPVASVRTMCVSWEISPEALRRAVGMFATNGAAPGSVVGPVRTAVADAVSAFNGVRIAACRLMFTLRSEGRLSIELELAGRGGAPVRVALVGEVPFVKSSIAHMGGHVEHINTADGELTLTALRPSSGRPVSVAYAATIILSGWLGLPGGVYDSPEIVER